MKILITEVSVNLGYARFTLTPEQAISLRDELNSIIEGRVRLVSGYSVLDADVPAFNKSATVLFMQGEDCVESALVVRL